MEHFLEVRLDAGASSLGDPRLADRIVDALGTLAGRRILDAGCGAGHLASRLAESGARVSGVDVCKGLLSRARRQAVTSCDFARADACFLPFKDRSFDAAACVLVLHYLERPALALKELSRVMRTGGSFVLADRIAGSEEALQRRWDRIERLRNGCFHRVLASPEIEGLLAGAGFTVLACEPYHQAVSLGAWLVGVEASNAREIRKELAQLRTGDPDGRIAGDDSRIHLRSQLYACRREREIE